MCLQCAADPGTEQGYCSECGCLIALFNGQPMCTPDECWCAKQPDVANWHAMADEAPDASEPWTPPDLDALFPPTAE